MMLFRPCCVVTALIIAAVSLSQGCKTRDADQEGRLSGAGDRAMGVLDSVTLADWEKRIQDAISQPAPVTLQEGCPRFFEDHRYSEEPSERVMLVSRLASLIRLQSDVQRAIAEASEQRMSALTLKAHTCQPSLLRRFVVRLASSEASAPSDYSNESVANDQLACLNAHEWAEGAIESKIKEIVDAFNEAVASKTDTEERLRNLTRKSDLQTTRLEILAHSRDILAGLWTVQTAFAENNDPEAWSRLLVVTQSVERLSWVLKRRIWQEASTGVSFPREAFGAASGVLQRGKALFNSKGQFIPDIYGETEDARSALKAAKETLPLAISSYARSHKAVLQLKFHPVLTKCVP